MTDNIGQNENHIKIFKAANLLFYASTLLFDINKLFSDSLLAQSDSLLASIDPENNIKFRPAELSPEEESEVNDIIAELLNKENNEEEE